MKKTNFTVKFISLLLVLCLLCICVGCAQKEGGSRLVKDASLAESTYGLGSDMGDYTVTDVNGNTYTFSEILKEKKAIVLNFWFINCEPCRMEFPYLQKAYDSYSDDIAVFALNPMDSKESDIQKYATQNGLSIPMAVAENTWITAFSLQGFPTTVVIDRYGTVAFEHMGMITEDGVFEKIFEFFTADDYEKTTVNSISDIK